jgi:hypothetical protein
MPKNWVMQQGCIIHFFWLFDLQLARQHSAQRAVALSSQHGWEGPLMRCALLLCLQMLVLCLPAMQQRKVGNLSMLQPDFACCMLHALAIQGCNRTVPIAHVLWRDMPSRCMVCKSTSAFPICTRPWRSSLRRFRPRPG